MSFLLSYQLSAPIPRSWRDCLSPNRPAQAARDELSNLVFLAAPPSQELLDLPPEQALAQVAALDPGRLTAQGIPLERALWRVERYADFLAARRALLADAVNALLDGVR